MRTRREVAGQMPRGSRVRLGGGRGSRGPGPARGCPPGLAAASESDDSPSCPSPPPLIGPDRMVPLSDPRGDDIPAFLIRYQARPTREPPLGSLSPAETKPAGGKCCYGGIPFSASCGGGVWHHHLLAFSVPASAPSTLPPPVPRPIACPRPSARLSPAKKKNASGTENTKTAPPISFSLSVSLPLRDRASP